MWLVAPCAPHLLPGVVPVVSLPAVKHYIGLSTTNMRDLVEAGAGVVPFYLATAVRQLERPFGSHGKSMQKYALKELRIKPSLTLPPFHKKKLTRTAQLHALNRAPAGVKIPATAVVPWVPVFNVVYRLLLTSLTRVPLYALHIVMLNVRLGIAGENKKGSGKDEIIFMELVF